MSWVFLNLFWKRHVQQCLQQMQHYTSIDPKQQQRMFPPRSCAIQNSWNCLAHSCLLFYSFITSTVQIRGNKREKKGEEGRQAPEPQPEAGGTRKSCWNRTPFLRKERREKKGDKHRNPRKNEEEPKNPWWNRTPFLRKERREKKKGDKHRNRAGTRRNQ